MYKKDKLRQNDEFRAMVGVKVFPNDTNLHNRRTLCVSINETNESGHGIGWWDYINAYVAHANTFIDRAKF